MGRGELPCDDDNRRPIVLSIGFPIKTLRNRRTGGVVMVYLVEAAFPSVADGVHSAITDDGCQLNDDLIFATKCVKHCSPGKP